MDSHLYLLTHTLEFLLLQSFIEHRSEPECEPVKVLIGQVSSAYRVIACFSETAGCITLSMWIYLEEISASLKKFQ